MCTLEIFQGTYSQLMVPGFVISLADGPLLLLNVLYYSFFDLSWPPMTSEDNQTLRALWKSSKEPTAC